MNKQQMILLKQEDETHLEKEANKGNSLADLLLKKLSLQTVVQSISVENTTKKEKK